MGQEQKGCVTCVDAWHMQVAVLAVVAEMVALLEGREVGASTVVSEGYAYERAQLRQALAEMKALGVEVVHEVVTTDWIGIPLRTADDDEPVWWLSVSLHAALS